MLPDPTGWVRRAAFVVWLAWALSYVLMACQLLAGAVHPHFLPLAVLVAVQIGGILVAIVLGLMRIILGPRRLGALAWLLAALIPVLLWVAHAGYGLQIARESEKPLNWLTKLTAVGAAAIADGYARIYYPERISGEHVVMICDRSGNSESNLAAMDRHIEHLGAVLGHPLESKVHWVRGDVLGLSGISFFGLALCSSPDPRRPGGLNKTDLHEVAHNVLHDQLPVGAMPPVILVEGWAESQSGRPRRELAQIAWWRRTNGGTISLRDAISPQWYSHNERLSYDQGAVIVDYLVRQYGGEKFFELMSTCRPKTIADDIERIYGLDLEELDRRCWADVRETLFGKQTSRALDTHEKLGLPIPPDDPSARREFLARFSDEIGKLQDLYRHARVVGTVTEEDGTGPENLPDYRDICEYDLLRDGDRFRLICVTRKTGDDTRLTTLSLTSAHTLSYAEMAFSLPHKVRYLDSPYVVLDEDVREWISQPQFRLRAAVSRKESGKRVVDVHFDSPLEIDGKLLYRGGSFSFLPDHHWALQEYKLCMMDEEIARPVVHRGFVEYAFSANGAPAFQRAETFWSPQEWWHKVTTEVHQIEFGPAPDEEFDPAKYGRSPPEESLLASLPRMSLWTAFGIAMAAAVLGTIDRRRARSDSALESSALSKSHAPAVGGLSWFDT